MKPLLLALLGLTVAVLPTRAADLVRREWTVDGVIREALIHLPEPASPGPVPVVFVFHGHGGSARDASWNLPFHQAWPAALVVFMQGLPTPGRLTDRAGDKRGWQAGPGEAGDRDLKFFDAVLRSLRADYRVDDRRIYATGHSNGGSFTFLLWAKRRDVFAAFGPSAAVAGRDYGRLVPAPVIMIAGANDELVRYPWQRLMLQVICRDNECGAGQAVGDNVTLFPSRIGDPVEIYVHDGGHEYPAEATALVVDFFQKHPRP